MSLLGIDVGMTSCRAMVIALDGSPLARAQREYQVITGPGGTRELDARQVWSAVRETIHQVTAQTQHDPIRALSVTSMGEAVTALSLEGRIQGLTILGPDRRGSQYVQQVEHALGSGRLFDITGNLPGPTYALSKLCWLRDNNPTLFTSTWRFVLWSGLIDHLLGGASTCDYSLASRTLLFDINHTQWSRQVLEACTLPRLKLPELAPAGTLLGAVSNNLARELGLPSGVRIVLGGRDLCCSALGAGVIHSGMALYSLSASIHLVPTFNAIPLTSLMFSRGLSMEHHVVPRLFVSHIHNQTGGRTLRWFRDNLAPLEKRQAQRRGSNVYTELLAEMPEEPTKLMVLPHFAPTGPPHFESRTSGVILGLDVRTTRGEIIKALLEGMTYYFAEIQELLEQVGIRIQIYRAIGGGARSERWLQLTADILGVPVEHVDLLEPAPLGAAILAGVGSGAFPSTAEAVAALVHVRRRYDPDPQRHQAYRDRVARYRELYPLLREYLHRLSDGD